MNREISILPLSIKIAKFKFELTDGKSSYSRSKFTNAGNFFAKVLIKSNGNIVFSEKGNKTKSKDYISSITKTDVLMNSELFRPPYGRITRKQKGEITGLGKRIIMWTWNSHDYNQKIGIETIIKKAKLIKGGDILLFHNNAKSMKNMMGSLPEVIRIIRDKRLTFKPISI